MSWKFVRATWELTVPHVPGLSACDVKFVLLALADHADDSGLCWPGVRRLVAFTQLSERTVQRSLAALQGLGWVRVHAYPQGGRGRSTEYILALLVPDLSTPLSGDLSNSVQPTPFEGPKGRQPDGVSGKGRQKPRQPSGKGRQTSIVPAPESVPTDNALRDFGAPPTTRNHHNHHMAPGGREEGGGGTAPAGSGPPAGGTSASSDHPEVDSGSRSAHNGPSADRGQRTARAAALVAQLSDRLTTGVVEHDAVVFGFKLAEITAALDRATPEQRTHLEKFCRWLNTKGASERVIQGCAAFVLMREVENPFAYFAAGQPARIAVEQWARG